MCRKLGNIRLPSTMLVSARDFVAHYFLAAPVFAVLPSLSPNQFATKTAWEDFCIPVKLILHLLLLVVCILNTGFALYLSFWSLFTKTDFALCYVYEKRLVFEKHLFAYILCV